MYSNGFKREENEYVDVCTMDESEDKENMPSKSLKHQAPSCSNQEIKQTNPIKHKTSLNEATEMNTNTGLNIEENGTESEDDNSQKKSTDAGTTTSRKEKSLGKLCKRFLLAMCEEAKSGKDVHLETVSKKMDVEKRRIYDIVNVMEALEAMSKTNKSFYKWNGLFELPQLMHTLEREAEEIKLPEKILQVEQAMCSLIELSASSSASSPSCSSEMAIKSETNSLLDSSDFDQNLMESKSLSLGDEQIITRERNGKNSLAQLCRRFLMVLLCNPKHKRRVSLDVASTVLIKDPTSEGFEPPSRCRRLYDIANVLVAMGLMKKVHYLFGTKKIPLFVYCGPEPNACPEASNLSMKEFLSRIGLPSIGNNSQQSILKMAFEKPPPSQPQILQKQPLKPKMLASNCLKTNTCDTKTFKRKYTETDENEEMFRKPQVKIQKMNEKIEIPKPLPRVRL